MSETLRRRIEEAAGYVRENTTVSPRVGIILGSGLGSLASQVDDAETIDYADIPHFARSTAPGHTGRLIMGGLEDQPVMVMQGRFHYYEGYSMEQITFPVRVLHALGGEILIESNAAGGMNPQFKAGELMLMVDHINLMGTNPLIGPNDDALGPRFPDMSEPYDSQLADLTQRMAWTEHIRLHQGVYVAVTGPSFETPAEYRFLRGIGADVVGMSTVPEVITARHCGLRVLGLSCITDECFPDCLEPLDFRKVIKTAERAEVVLTRLVLRVLKELPTAEG